MFKNGQMAAARTYQVVAGGTDVHHDVLLSNLAVSAFSDGVSDYIGDQLLPAVPVANQSNKYAVIDKAAFLRSHDGLRAPRTKARRIEWSVSSDSYYAPNYALAAEMPLEDLANADAVFMYRQQHVNLITADLRRAQEIRIANLLTTAANLGSGTTLSGTRVWSDFVNSDPLADINTAQAFIQHTTGLVANTVVLDFDTYKVLRRHPDLLDLYKYTQGGQLTQDQIREVFDVSNLLIARGVKENSLEGGTSSMTMIWGNIALFAHIEPANGLQTRTLGLRFQWTPDGFPSAFAAGTQRFAGPGTRQVEVVEVGHFQAEKIVAPNLGYLIGSTI